MRPASTQNQGVSLRQLFPQAQFCGCHDIRVQSLSSDARACQPGDAFIAILDEYGDGHHQTLRALGQGAEAVISERLLPVQVPQCVLPDTRIAAGKLFHALAGDPSLHLGTIGVTGTNGKTTTSWLIASILQQAKEQAGFLTTLGRSDSVEETLSGQTTPGAPELADWLARIRANGGRYGVVELSSRALATRRTTGLQLDGAVLTNLRRDHLDFHGSARNYRKAKARIFEHLKPEGFAVFNADDIASQAMLREFSKPAITFGMRQPAEITARVVERFASEQTFLLMAGNEAVPVRTHMIGDHHVMNCLAAAAVGLVLGVDMPTIVRGLEAVSQLPSRLDRIECGQEFGVFVDCADTPDRLAVSLHALRQVTPGKVISVSSGSEDRPESDLPMLGRVLERACDVRIITNSDPTECRSLEAAHEILDGFDCPARAHLIPRRQQAIEWALQQAQPGDSILISGRGRRRDTTNCDVDVAKRWLRDESEQPQIIRAAGYFAK